MRAGVDDLLCGLFAAQNYQQVRDHRCLPLFVQLDDAFLSETLQAQPQARQDARGMLGDLLPGSRCIPYVRLPYRYLTHLR
jgi:hypothetical protein